MYILDTNVISEIMSGSPDRQVSQWVEKKPIERLFTASICQAEILAGISVLPTGRRRSDLEQVADAIFRKDFEGRILPFDAAAAVAYAKILAARKGAGRPIATIDLMIASVARSQKATMVTRDIGGFEGCGIDLVNPWNASEV